MRSFEDSLNAHKSELTEALIVFGEHKRVGKALAELETQRPEFYKFYKDGQESRQNEVDELQKQVTDLDNRATKYALDAMATAKLNAELQKRVDAVKQLIEEYRDPPTEDKTFQHALSIVAYELEQALKGGGE